MRKTGNVDYYGQPRDMKPNGDWGKSLTIQSDAHLADINVIMRDFVDEGRDILDVAKMEFADVSEFGDYHDVMMEVRRAEETFLELPSKVREVFGHSVENFLDTVHDDDKRAKLVAAGFIKAEEDAAQGGGASGQPQIGEAGSPAAAGSGQEVGGGSPE